MNFFFPVRPQEFDLMPSYSNANWWHLKSRKFYSFLTVVSSKVHWRLFNQHYTTRIHFFYCSDFQSYSKSKWHCLCLLWWWCEGMLQLGSPKQILQVQTFFGKKFCTKSDFYIPPRQYLAGFLVSVCSRNGSLCVVLGFSNAVVAVAALSLTQPGNRDWKKCVKSFLMMNPPWCRLD